MQIMSGFYTRFSCVVVSAFVLGMMFFAEVYASRDNQRQEQLQSLLDDVITSSNTSGAVLLVQDAEQIWVVASGTSDISGNRSTQTGDQFRIASLTKLYVSVLTLKLVEAGKLSLDEPVSSYLPEDVTRLVPNASQISLRHLLGMTSGLYDYLDSPEYETSMASRSMKLPWRVKELLAYTEGQQPYFRPGQSFDYSNTSYLLVQEVIETVTASSLSKQLDKYIFVPLDLNESWLEVSSERLPSIQGYEDDEDVTEINDAIGLADGGMISNVTSIAKFMEALFVKKILLDDTSMHNMLNARGGDYGLGVEVLDTSRGLVLGHNGASAGFTSEAYYLSEHGVIFVLLTNDVDSDFADEVLGKSLKIILN